MRRACISSLGVILGVVVAAILALGVSTPAHAEHLVTSDDVVFHLVAEGASGQGDADADGVSDASDVCADTTFTAGPVKPKLNDHPAEPKHNQNPAKLKANHYWSTSEAGFVERTGAIGYTLEETGGCSAEQIIAAAGLGKGHMKNGISIGAMKKWVASLEK
jgi:hypothetical protein